MSVIESEKAVSESICKLFYEEKIHKKRSATMPNMDRHKRERECSTDRRKHTPFVVKSKPNLRFIDKFA